MKKTLSMVLALVIILLCGNVVAVAYDNKISPQLLEVIENGDPNDTVGIGISFYGKQPNASQMPSWPDVEQARIELEEYYDNWYKTEIVPVVFDGIEYKELFVGSGLVIVSVKICDIEKIADNSIVMQINYFKNSDMDYADDKKYENNFIECYVGDREYYEYEEVYYHYSNNEVIDWCLVKGEASQVALTTMCYLKFDDFVLKSPSLCYPFDMKYAVYDVEKEEFVDLVDDYDKLEQYEGLIDVLRALDKSVMLGDGDEDGELSILDATSIQMELAGLGRIWDNYTDRRGVTGRFSDIDSDGELSVLDATAIQLKLAGLE